MSGAEAFWNFSWDEQSRYDMPAVYDYVLGQTGNKDLVYVGHSQGTTQMFAALSDETIAPLIQPRTSYYIALAPVAYVGNVESQMLHELSRSYLPEMMLRFGMEEWLPDEFLLHYIDPKLCAVDASFCSSLLVAVGGCSLQQKNVSAVVNYLKIQPAGTSVKNLVHWTQSIREDTYQMFDYESEKKNEEHYKQKQPPQYDLSKINLPPKTLFFTGGMDTLADPTDVNRLIRLMQIATADDASKMPLDYNILSYDHLDFTIAITANVQVYDKILKHLSED